MQPNDRIRKKKSKLVEMVRIVKEMWKEKDNTDRRKSAQLNGMCYN